MAQLVKLMLAAHMEASVHVLPALLRIQLLANILGKTAEDSPSACAPATHVGDPEVHCSGLWLGPSLASAVIWGK